MIYRIIENSRNEKNGLKVYWVLWYQVDKSIMNKIISVSVPTVCSENGSRWKIYFGYNLKLMEKNRDINSILSSVLTCYVATIILYVPFHDILKKPAVIRMWANISYYLSDNEVVSSSWMTR